MISLDPDEIRRVLRDEIARLGNLIGADGYELIGFDPHIDSGYPYIEVGDDATMHWIVKERGKTLEHRTTVDSDEVLYWSFEAMTASPASWCAARYGGKSQDFRIGYWAKQAELLLIVNPAWARRWRADLASRQPADVALMPAVPDRDGDIVT